MRQREDMRRHLGCGHRRLEGQDLAFAKRDVEAIITEGGNHREAFFSDTDAGTGTLRLNFSHAGEADMEIGLRTLRELLEEAVAHQ